MNCKQSLVDTWYELRVSSAITGNGEWKLIIGQVTDDLVMAFRQLPDFFVFRMEITFMELQRSLVGAMSEYPERCLCTVKIMVIDLNNL